MCEVDRSLNDCDLTLAKFSQSYSGEYLRKVVYKGTFCRVHFLVDNCQLPNKVKPV